MNLRLARQLAGVLTALLTTTVLATGLTSGPASASPVDPYAGYESQQTCTNATKPGTAYLLRWLMRQYPGTGSAGTLRPCDSGGNSEHKDGRALDWAVDAADPVQAAKAERFLDRVFATDKNGNHDALARRMGIMYIIWNDHIYSSYNNEFQKRDYLASGCRTRKTCSKTSRHRDHVHISLSFSGASAQTTFYRARNVRSIPVLLPGTNQLDPVRTAIAKLQVPSTGGVVETGFKLTRGTTYRVVADGLVRTGPGTSISDAACRWSAYGWTPNDAGLLLNGKSPWSTDCDGRHTHVASYKAPRTDFLKLRVGDEHVGNNKGSLSFYILREDIPARTVASHPAASRRHPHAAKLAGPSAKRLHKEMVTVGARARRGVLTTHSLRKGASYRVVVKGVAKSGNDTFDGNCVRYAGRLRPQHTLDLTRPSADHLSLYIQGVKADLRVPGSKAKCNGSTHRYIGRIKAVVRGKARVQVWDPYTFADNSGSLTVHLRKR